MRNGFYLFQDNMNYSKVYGYVLLVLLTACEARDNSKYPTLAYLRATADSVANISSATTAIDTLRPTEDITRMTEVQQQNAITDFAETLIGVPYKYGACDPEVGFDCSGFISYVFHHFNIAVPRSSADFTRTGVDVPVNNSRRGDIILFTGTDSTETGIGHVGIITNNTNGTINFIHATSRKQMSVTITPLNDYYKSRFVKVVRVIKVDGA